MLIYPVSQLNCFSVTKPLIMVLLKSPFDGKNPSWKFRAPLQCASLRVPFHSLTKAFNRVKNLLEARGLGLQLFFKGLSEENGRYLWLSLPLFVFCSVPLSDRLSQKPCPLQLDLQKPPRISATTVSSLYPRRTRSKTPALKEKVFATERMQDNKCFLVKTFSGPSQF